MKLWNWLRSPSSEGQPKIQTQGRSLKAAVTASACGLLQVCPLLSVPPKASLLACWVITSPVFPRNLGKTRAISTWGCSLPKASPRFSSLASSLPRPVGLAPAWWCHLMALNKSTRQELLSMASLCWGRWNAAGSSGPISQLPEGPESVSCATDTQYIHGCGKEFKGEGGKRGKSYIPADFLSSCV